MVNSPENQNCVSSRTPSELMTEIKEHLTASLQAIVSYKAKSETASEIIRMAYRPGIVSPLMARAESSARKAVREEVAARILDAIMNVFIRIGLTEVEITNLKRSISSSISAIGYNESLVSERYPEFKENAVLAVSLVGLCPVKDLIPKGYTLLESGSLINYSGAQP